jgi:hypothetical protein
MTTRDESRLALGAAAVMTPRQAAELLPWGDSSALQWLQSRGLVHVVDGRRVVIWGDVLDAIRGRPQDEQVPTPAIRLAPAGKAERWRRRSQTSSS